ncbi:Uncaracterized surface protein containing fasciclin (FAS1) repeats [Cellulosimicrobium aquatile]|uniref:Uncaracterized surface protein containing fasciclin (FAS1) repeats n=1 Tax=Cellulosimicrobium aquatile TaxID=1612203 RepID=A0A1N6QKB2_9MICO|nr:MULTISPECIES: fasciclin domain-containing protein [Cellulosimicrobium]NMF28752.1 fasciclin domain-containing protein [Cellulosimicrobium aquatile]SIQ17071.1 Uncaracterized surface protein containing fasciclin (FAS1) repeats [Cellulosimicrobium aquatile]
MNVRTRTSYAVAGIATLAVLGLSACSSDTDTGSDSTTTDSQSDTMTDDSTSDDMTDDSTEGSDDMAADPAANLVGPGCAAYAEQVPDGAGSITGMSTDPVAVAASNNPLLTTLTAAVSGELNPDVNLVDTLNGGEFTVFAPVDDAFAKIDAATLESLKTDSDTLTKILTYHVVPGQLTPDQVAGEHETVEGGTVEVTGSGDELMVNDAAVVCGGVMTQNATVYLVDTVLMPTM